MSIGSSVFHPLMYDIAKHRLDRVPFIHIELRGGEFMVRGQQECDLGHQIPTDSGRPDGIFAKWRWNGSKLVVSNDRYGFYPVFYFATKTGICVSPVVGRLLAEGADRSIDDAAMAVFLRLGYMLGDATPFRSIRLLPPDGELEWSAEGLKIRGRRSIPRQSPLSREAALEGFIHLFNQAVARRPPRGRCVMPLSGGRDSRHIFLELCRREWKPHHCVTIDVRNEGDAAVSAELAAYADVPLKLIRPARPMLETETRRNLEASFCSDEHTWSLTLADYLANTAGCVYDGIAGDVLSQSRSLTPKRQRWFETEDFTSLARDLIRNMDKFTSDALPSTVRTRWSSELAIEQIETELRQCSSAANPMAAFIFWNRTRREIALYSYGYLRETQYVYAPFLDHDLFDHLASLPASLLLDRRLHDDTIGRAYPGAAGIPYASKTGLTPMNDDALAAFAATGLRLLVQARRSEWIARSSYGFRLLRARFWAPRRAEASWLSSRCLYLLQLEEVMQNGLPWPA